MADNNEYICMEPDCNDVKKEMPSMAQMAKNLFSTGKDVVTGALQGDGVFTTEEISEHRLSICTSCPSFEQEQKRCRECGCFMLTKATLKKASCPLGKWSEV